MFYPVVEAGIAMMAVNAVWSREVTLMAPEEFLQMYQEAEAGIRAQYEAGGQVLKRYETGEIMERILWGMTALSCDAVLLVGMNETEIELYQRSIRLTGEFGTYTFSISAWAPDMLEDATEYLIRSIEWKEEP